MVIKNKDGTTYRLKHPNPLVLEQIHWDDVELHNIRLFGKNNDLISEAPASPKVEVQFVAPKEPLPEITLPTPEITLPTPELPAEPPKISDKIARNTIVMFCLPGKLVEQKDDLYRESYSTVVYGHQFSLEAVVLDRGDLITKFWTNQPISVYSVLFPSVYKNGNKYGEHRWWQVNQIIEEGGGYTLVTVPSSYQPSF